MKISPKSYSLKAFFGIRGFACLSVILFHLSDPPTIENYPFLSTLSFLRDLAFIKHGHRWVILFFVLSGFVLTQKYVLGSEANYLRNRIIRIFPLHWFLIILFYFKRNTDLKRFNDDSFFHQIFLIQSWFTDYRFTWNYPAWTLSSEWFLYLFFFVILALLKKNILKHKSLLSILLICICLLSFTSFHVGNFNVYIRDDLRDFLLGCCVALIIKNEFVVNVFSSKLFFFISLFITYLLFHFQIFQLLSLSFVLMIGSIFYNQEWIRKLLVSKFLGLIGMVSFSMYMIHIYLIEILGNVLMPFNPLLSTGAYFLALLVLGIFTFEIFENKLCRILKKI